MIGSAVSFCSCLLPIRDDIIASLSGKSTYVTVQIRGGQLSNDFKEGIFRPDGYFPRGMSLASGEPYIVQKVDAATGNRRYGLEALTLGDKTFGITCNKDFPVLSLKAGVVQYFGDFFVVADGQGAKFTHTDDIESAQAYINKEYPDKHWILQRGEVASAKAPECHSGGGGIIYIHVPRR